MKRIRIWLKDLTLFQQFFAIGFLVIANFLILFLMLLNYQMDSFIKNQMYQYIHQSQNNYKSALIQGYDLIDPNVDHVVYNIKSKQIIKGKLINQIELDEGIYNFKDEREDFKDRVNGRDLIYSILKIDDERLLISEISYTYYINFRQTLVENIANLNTILIITLFILFLIWITSVISPLKKIKQYIVKIKNEEDAELNIDRRDEIGEVASALVDMQNELSKQNQIKQEMLQNISHDLKTPIATIKSYGEAIKDGVYPYETLEKSVDVIVEHAKRLENKVYNLITFNKLGYLKEEFDQHKKVDMNKIINGVILGAKVLRPEIEIILNINDVEFTGDEESWRILVENLIDNALRYAKKKVIIELREAYFSVYNDGSSLDNENIEKLFKPYEKGSGGRFGLGLSIVKRVCDAYDYKVKCENIDDGVMFKVFKQLPLKNKKGKKI